MLQKKVVRIFASENFRAHTNSIFLEYTILEIQDIYKYNLESCYICIYIVLYYICPGTVNIACRLKVAFKRHHNWNFETPTHNWNKRAKQLKIKLIEYS